jgi:hypothetical protein
MGNERVSVALMMRPGRILRDENGLLGWSREGERATSVGDAVTD